jgi:hypothetical protein
MTTIPSHKDSHRRSEVQRGRLPATTLPCPSTFAKTSTRLRSGTATLAHRPVARGWLAASASQHHDGDVGKR